MATLQASRIKEALNRARGVGRIEEPLTIAGCELVLQNLTPHEFEGIMTDVEPLEEMEYAFGYQINHVARSIVELNGADLRDVEFIEEEIPADGFLVQVEVPTDTAAKDVVAKLRGLGIEGTVQPPSGEETRTVKIERYRWIRDQVVSTWTKEALTVAWRKFMELLAKADEQAKDGVTFRIPDETTEERYRRLIHDMAETATDLPVEMVDSILSEYDMVRKSGLVELEAANEKLREASQEAPKPAPESVASPARPEPPKSTPEPQGEPAGPPPEVLAAMARRSPMNQQAVEVPPPATSAEPPVVSAQRRAGVPEQIRRAAEQNSAVLIRDADSENPPPPPIGLSTRRGRAAEIAELETQVDPSLADVSQDLLPNNGGVAEISKKQTGVDGAALSKILDKPPVVGVNRKYKPPARP